MRDECTDDVDWEIRRCMKRIKDRLKVTKNEKERLYLMNELRKIHEVKREVNKLSKLLQSEKANSHRGYNAAVRTGVE